VSWSLVHNSPSECSVSECDREASLTRRSWPTRGCCTMVEKNYFQLRLNACTHHGDEVLCEAVTNRFKY